MENIKGENRQHGTKMTPVFRTVTPFTRIRNSVAV
jgi:hypothetical protein